MIYIYDILLNLNKKLIEFFEWEDEDNILYVRKIPIYRVNDDFIYNIINTKIVVDKSFLNSIESKIQFCDNNSEMYKYVCLFTNNKIIVGISFDSSGVQKEISRLLIDEEKEILVLTESLKIQDISYKIMKNDKVNYSNMTREEEKIINCLKTEIKKLYNENKIEKLNYLYYEYFNTTCNEKNKVFNNLIESLEDKFNEKHINLYNLIKLSYEKK